LDFAADPRFSDPIWFPGRGKEGREGAGNSGKKKGQVRKGNGKGGGEGEG